MCSFQLESNTARYFLRSCMKTFGSRGCEATWWFPWHVLWLRHITFVTADIRWQEAEGRMHIHTYSTNTPSVCTPTLVRTKWNICSDWYETTWAARRRNLQQTEKKKKGSETLVQVIRFFWRKKHNINSRRSVMRDQPYFYTKWLFALRPEDRRNFSSRFHGLKVHINPDFKNKSCCCWQTGGATYYFQHMICQMSPLFINLCIHIKSPSIVFLNVGVHEIIFFIIMIFFHFHEYKSSLNDIQHRKIS